MHSKDSGLSNPSSKSPAAATAPTATYVTVEKQAQTARQIDSFTQLVQSAGLETDAAQDVVAAYTDTVRTDDRQSAIKLKTTVKRAAEQKAESDADLNVAKLELEASLEAPYAALQSATAETVAAAQARYDRAVRIAQAKLDAARVKAKNKAATINDSIVEAAENLRQNTVQKQQQSDTMQASDGVVGNEGGGKSAGTDDSAFNDKEERSISEKIELLDDYIKSNKIGILPLSSDEILSFTDGSLKLAQNVVNATKEVIPGKSVSELVDIFKLPNDPASSSLSTYQTRIWYRWQESLIGSRLDYSKLLKQVARDAFDMRNEIRAKARASMSDRALAELLMKKERNLTFRELVKRNKDKGLTGDELWRKIIKSSMSSRDYINKLFQIE